MELSGQFEDAKNQDGLGNRLGEKRVGAPETEKVQVPFLPQDPYSPHLQGSVSDSIMLVVGTGTRGTGSPVLGQGWVGREEIRA